MAKESFIETLRWRGMLHDATPGIEEHLATGTRRSYIGFDPTARSLTIGNYVQIMILNLFQQSGHTPVVLMGGATGRIGDPSGRDAERELKSYDELDTNLQRQEEQMRKLLIFEGVENAAIMLNNLDFYHKMSALDFLRDVGKHMTISYMLAKDSVQKRLDTGISYTEFSYQLLQAYDFLCLYRDHGCTMQMGGSDQWGNITAGTEFIRKNISDARAYAVTTPLLTKSDGSKFGKSEHGNIWLDPSMTSPYQFYQFWINSDDRDISRFLRFFSLKSREEIEALDAQLSSEPRSVKKILADELTSRIHSAEDCKNAVKVSTLLFDPKAGRDDLLSMSVGALAMIAAEVPHHPIPKALLAERQNIVDLLADHAQISASRSEARRAIQGNAISVNKLKIDTPEHMITPENLLHGRYLLIENGRKNKFVIVAM